MADIAHMAISRRLLGHFARCMKRISLCTPSCHDNTPGMAGIAADYWLEAKDNAVMLKTILASAQAMSRRRAAPPPLRSRDRLSFQI